jgi:hypothetical protein
MGMGRRRYGSEEQATGRIYARRVRLDRGGYDSGGAYWGTGAPLYRVFDEGGNFEDFVRAPSSVAAKTSFFPSTKHRKTR